VRRRRALLRRSPGHFVVSTTSPARRSRACSERRRSR
jgi:hypothetical protein